MRGKAGEAIFEGARTPAFTAIQGQVWDPGGNLPAYFVYVCQKVFDRGELEAYWAKIGATLEGYSAKSIAAYTHFEQLEGDEVDGAAVIEFPSFEKAKEWYESPAYRAIRHHRMNGAKYIGLLMEGGALPPELRMPHTKGRRKGEP